MSYQSRQTREAVTVASGWFNTDQDYSADDLLSEARALMPTVGTDEDDDQRLAVIFTELDRRIREGRDMPSEWQCRKFHESDD